jgi:hypothetical protein
MCTVFKAAIRRVLPHALLVVDQFHVVQLANRAVTEVRRRVTLTYPTPPRTPQPRLTSKSPLIGLSPRCRFTCATRKYRGGARGYRGRLSRYYAGNPIGLSAGGAARVGAGTRLAVTVRLPEYRPKS